MSRATQSIFTSATQAQGIAPIPTPTVDYGVTTDFSTLEIRATVKAGRKSQTLFTFHGGSVMKSKKGNLFTAFMLRPFIYKEKDGVKEIAVNDKGELQHSSVKSFLVKSVEQNIPEKIAPFIEVLKTSPTPQREAGIAVAAQTFGVTQEEIVKYLYQTSTLDHKEISPSKFLNNLFKHENVRFKANISSKWESRIENILEKISEEDKYSIILRFDLTRVNAIKDLLETQGYNEGGELEARRHPLTGDVILLQEVSVPLTYIGIEKGSTYDEDTTKYLNPMLSISAAMNATKDEENPTYMDYSILEARAEKVNAWKANMSKFTGKKFLQNSGIVDTLYKLAESYASGSQEALNEANSIFEALRAEERVGEVKANSIWSTFQGKVQEATNQPEPENKSSDNNSTQQEVESQEETVTTVTNDAVDMLSSPAFSLDALLGMNLAIDEE